MNKYYAKVRDEFERLVEAEKRNPELTRQATKDIHCLLDIMSNMEILRMVDGLDESHSNDYNEARHGAHYKSEYHHAEPRREWEKSYETDDADMAKSWAAHMKNADGTTGPHWTVAQTAPFAETREITVKPEMWNLTMNMMYSDYYNTAKKHNVNNPNFYADLAHDFLTDADGGEAEEKLKAYYRAIVKD